MKPFKLSDIARAEMGEDKVKTFTKPVGEHRMNEGYQWVRFKSRTPDFRNRLRRS